MYNFLGILLDLLFPPVLTSKHIASLTPANSADLPPYITSLYAYKDPHVHHAIWELKYRGNREVATIFGKILAKKIREQDIKEALIIPLPLSKERRKERGWNQSELLGQALVDNNPTLRLQLDILEKIRHTIPQTKLNRKERLENLKNCFAVTPHKQAEVFQKNIILLDDVCTTGSTISEARNTLLQAGAKNVIGFTVAH
jgi:ComF family protein